MGIYINPGYKRFQEAVSSEIYIDKTELIAYTNQCVNTEQKYICVSRPRRFGKSIAANMLAAYYGCKVSSDELFHDYKIAAKDSYHQHLNQYNVIFLNMQEFLSNSANMTEMTDLIKRSILWELLEEWPDFRYFDQHNLVRTLNDVFHNTQAPFIFIIDEWDCIFREKKNHFEEQKEYLDFLRLLLKDQAYVGLAYMTGILPVKKYGTHSALNMFDEYSMTNPGPLAEFSGFTETEVRNLCEVYHMDFDEAERWYDGYCFDGTEHIYSPRSVVRAMMNHRYDSYWNQTESFEALRTYIVMNFDGLKDAVTRLLAGERVGIDTESFSNDMNTFHVADDVLTLLIHLGYLAYDFIRKEVYIPNSEVAGAFTAAVRASGWNKVAKAIENSDRLLQAVWSQDETSVAAGIEEVHLETSILAYNDENALSCTIALALYSAKEYYLTVREFPTGKGFADLVYLPRGKYYDKPALVVELKWNKPAQCAITQIKEKQYPKSLADYEGRILLVGISYDPESKLHECIIEPA